VHKKEKEFTPRVVAPPYNMRVVVHDPTSFVNPTDEDDRPEVCCITGGGAWRTFFFVGLVKAVQEATTAEERKKWAFAGCSSGALIALAMAIEYPHAQLLQLYKDMLRLANQELLGVVGAGVKGPGGIIVWKVLRSMPEAELIARIRGRFAVTFNSRSSLLHGYTAYQASDFDSVDEVFEAICGSGNIPGFTDWRTLFCPWRVGHVSPALDGGYTWASRRPCLPCRSTFYSLCCGEVPGGDATLPAGISTDVAPSAYVPVRKCFFTPSADYVSEMISDGYAQGKAFLSSERWAARKKATAGRQPLAELRVHSSL
jgi:pimeloyl-ACP methyl ester carboxylesterase